VSSSARAIVDERFLRPPYWDGFKTLFASRCPRISLRVLNKEMGRYDNVFAASLLGFKIGIMIASFHVLGEVAH